MRLPQIQATVLITQYVIIMNTHEEKDAQIVTSKGHQRQSALVYLKERSRNKDEKKENKILHIFF